MRTWILVVVLVAACKGKSDEKEKAAVRAAIAVPKVEVAAVLAKESRKMPWLLVVEDAGFRVGAAASWAELDAGEVKLSKKPGRLDEIGPLIREDFAMGKSPTETIASIDDFNEADVHLDLGPLDERSARNMDDPPPPEDEDKPDDGADESGGTGTAMVLEEGKMGKKDSDRAEGQYKMKKNQEDPVLARMQAAENARAAGILVSSVSDNIEFRPRADGMPSRAAQVQGAVIEDGTIEPLRELIVIAPTAKATKLIEVVRATDGAIAVSQGGKIRPLRLDFVTRGSAKPPNGWVEVRVSAKGLELEAVPDKPLEVTDLKKLATALGEVRKARETDARAPVDVLVAADVEVQRLIDVVVALDAAGVRTIGMGPTLTTAELARRGHRIPTVVFGQPTSVGELDKAEIRRSIKQVKSKLLECYTKFLVTKPDLEGTVETQFTITPKGTVGATTASGVDPDVAKCVAGAIKQIEFPKPRGGGDVQVSYPFTMRP